MVERVDILRRLLKLPQAYSLPPPLMSTPLMVVVIARFFSCVKLPLAIFIKVTPGTTNILIRTLIIVLLTWKHIFNKKYIFPHTD